MRQLVLLFIFIACIVTAFGQKAEKVKIALLGTIHFTPSTKDKYKNAALNTSESSRQKQIQQVVNRVSAFQPNKICVEIPVGKQAKTDSLYQAYLDGKYNLEQDEIDQLGFQTARQLGLPRLTCVNYLGRFDTDSMNKFALANNQGDVLTNLDTFAKQFMSDLQSKQQSLSLSDYLIFLNSRKALQSNLSFYTNYITRIGKNGNYVGTDVVAEWYATNLHIYTNILRQIEPSDKAVLVIFGQGHIPILKHLFESNPQFEVVEIKELLRNEFVRKSIDRKSPK